RNRTGAAMPRDRIAWHRSRPSESGSPMSMITASGALRAAAPSASSPRVTAETSNPSSPSPRRRRPRRSASSSTTSTSGVGIVLPIFLQPARAPGAPALNRTPPLSALTQDLAERQAAELAARQRGGEDRSDQR